MSEQYIRIHRIPYEEPNQVHLEVTASNGWQRAKLEIYSNASDLRGLAAHLREFPRERGDAALWELGSERPEDRFAFYFSLRVFQTSALGDCAIEIKMNNNREPPYRALSEFSLTVLPADLDRLADLLDQFSYLGHRILEWRVTEGFLQESL